MSGGRFLRDTVIAALGASLVIAAHAGAVRLIMSAERPATAPAAAFVVELVDLPPPPAEIGAMLPALAALAPPVFPTPGPASPPEAAPTAEPAPTAGPGPTAAQATTVEVAPPVEVAPLVEVVPAAEPAPSAGQADAAFNADAARSGTSARTAAAAEPVPSAEPVPAADPVPSAEPAPSVELAQTVIPAPSVERGTTAGPAPEGKPLPGDRAPASVPVVETPRTAPVAIVPVPALAPLPPIADFAALARPGTPPLSHSGRPPSRPANLVRTDTGGATRQARGAAATPREPAPDTRKQPTAAKAAQARSQPGSPARGNRATAAPAPARQGSATAPPASAARSAAVAAPPAAPSAAGVRDWASPVGARISRHMARTRLPGARAAVRVSLSVTVAPSGAVAARLAGTTGDPRVDQAIARQAARLPRMPAPPGGRAQSFVLPITVKP